MLLNGILLLTLGVIATIAPLFSSVQATAAEESAGRSPDDPVEYVVDMRR